ncbi:MAG: SRPBCC domain-containing protein [Pseudomonadota bacterium]
MKTHTKIEGDMLTVHRIYDASQSDVFDAWIDASKTTHWWGCGQTSKVVSTIDARKNGRYQHLMSIEGVGDHLIDGVLVEFDPPKLLAYTIPGMSEDEPMLVRVTFVSVGDGTRVTLVQSALPSALHDTVAAGWTASFERLATFFDGARRAA